MTSDDSPSTGAADRRRYPAWVIWGAGLVGGAGVLAVQFWPVRDAVEDSLTDRSGEALDAAGYGAVEIRFSGRDGVVSGEVGEPADAADIEELVRDVEGVRVVRTDDLQVRGAHDDTGDAGDDTDVEAAAEPTEETEPEPAPADEPADEDGEPTEEPADTDDTADSDEPADEGADAAGADEPTETPDPTEPGEPTGGDADASSEPDHEQAPPSGSAGSVPDVQEALDVLSTITFESERFGLSDDAAPVLDLAAEIILSGPPDQRYEVRAHTDTTGYSGYNEWLSNARASAARDALVERGVPGERLATVGLGETQPLVDPETSDADRERNRRVEFVAVE